MSYLVHKTVLKKITKHHYMQQFTTVSPYLKKKYILPLNEVNYVLMVYKTVLNFFLIILPKKILYATIYHSFPLFSPLHLTKRAEYCNNK